MQLNRREIWKDPVWSKVIAALILGTASVIAITFIPDWETKIPALLRSEINIKIWLLVAMMLAMIVACCYFKSGRQEKNENITSAQWFAEIEEQIRDCNYARIYLREFTHPDKFRSEHRESLFSFMTSLANRLKAGADIKIIAYHDTPSEKSGVDWLKVEVQDDKALLEKIKLIQIQPTSNASSMYLFDNGIVIYNRRSKSNYTYHIDDQKGSIVHLLIENGFAMTEKGLS
ncbi:MULTISPECIES: hypothetical protein [unclassified Herbaspirillum]|uniref:hypothetical protein n=1 Tax=unclassified Herbaspirillum TaxID=2624150 RepID=UPI000E2FEA0B|nr:MULTISPECIES: hypothetical protein [unclassified Herbaspirillum]RFB67528.1 hypothetical protein DZB54_20420 [Herbaspirillum sp. 3R-3a1]TFI05136.1 hypothetical protein E4P32_23380 [Herbaspirillum sp. 3R11]TFI12534.1 hypothetical protein E4P31_20985 [Herbaspirillum sp. 3R-11]TFI28333.1 hypothetical protein E4P30_08510 [Herbaspirillum sp. 3C11]